MHEVHKQQAVHGFSAPVLFQCTVIVEVVLHVYKLVLGAPRQVMPVFDLHSNMTGPRHAMFLLA